MNKKDMRKNVVPYILFVGLMLVLFYMYKVMSVKVNELTFNEFMGKITEGNVEKIEVTPSNDGGVYNIEG